MPAYSEVAVKTFFEVAEQFGGFAKQSLLPLNAIGDVEGVVLKSDGVRTPRGFREAYQSFCADGWNGLPCDTAFGGQGLPHALHAVMREAMNSANLSFGLLHDLNCGVYKAIAAHGSPALKELHLPKLIDGSWAGAMCLTEPQAGADLGLLKTLAKPSGDGAWRITGRKIFITWGDQDLSENVVHLVLARTQGAPDGVRGISLFVVPKYLPEDGGMGARNSAEAIGVEHKMGIHGSPTCAMAFDDAKGWLVGEETRGLAHMFTMMNAARVSVALQGLGIAETALQTALAYAGERLQGRAASGSAAPHLPADPLIVHGDIRRRCYLMRGWVEGGRALTYELGLLLDRSTKAPTETERRAAEARWRC